MFTPDHEAFVGHIELAKRAIDEALMDFRKQQGRDVDAWLEVVR